MRFSFEPPYVLHAVSPRSEKGPPRSRVKRKAHEEKGFSFRREWGCRVASIGLARPMTTPGIFQELLGVAGGSSLTIEGTSNIPRRDCKRLH